MQSRRAERTSSGTRGVIPFATIDLEGGDEDGGDGGKRDGFKLDMMEWKELEGVSAFYVHRASKMPFRTGMLLNRFYCIKACTGAVILYAGERVDLGSMCWRGMQRRYCLYIFSLDGVLVFTSERRRNKCCSKGGRDGGPPPPEAVVANAGNWSEFDLALTKCHWARGEFMGRVRDECSKCDAKYSVEEVAGKGLRTSRLKTGNLCPMFDCRRKKFDIMDHHGNVVGHFRERMDKLSEHHRRGETHFGVEFPRDYHPRTKLLLLAGIMDIWYEQNDRGSGGGGGGGDFERLPGLHPHCPPGQVIGILPKSFTRGPDFPRPVFKPSAGPPPKAPWTQCVERHVVSDQVRRPLARWTHWRPLPAVVIPCSEMERIQGTIKSSERRREACERARKERGCEGAASAQRHSAWNYTVESLLARKKEEAAWKEEELKREDERLVESCTRKREKLGADSYAAAKKKLLEEKGLIKKFHAAMSMSKQLKDDEELRRRKGEGVGDCMDAACSAEASSNSCMHNTSPDDCAFQGGNNKELGKKPCGNPAIMELLKLDEERVKERNAEIERAKCELREARAKIPMEYSPSYLKYIAEPEACDENDEGNCKKKREEQEGRRKELLEEIGDKLASHAFIEQTEAEIERQACEYNDYKRRVNLMRKEKEKGEIEARVKCRIANSEKTAKMVEESLKKKRGGGWPSEYDKLREVWEREFLEKEKNRYARRQGIIDEACIRLAQTADIACCKRAALDPTHEWEKQICTAKQDYEKECLDNDERRGKAKELQEFHLRQIANKFSAEDNERCMNAVWGEKARVNYDCDLREMQEYAQTQLREWKEKGRDLGPLKKALRQWEYDSGMSPGLWANTYMTSVPMEDGKRMSFQTSGERLGFWKRSESET